MELAFDLGLGGWAIVVIGAVAFGLVAQFIGRTTTGYEWLVDGIAALVGAVVASEFVIAWQAIEPVFDGLALVPALIGGLVVGIVVEAITRLTTGGSYTGRTMGV